MTSGERVPLPGGAKVEKSSSAPLCTEGGKHDSSVSGGMLTLNFFGLRGEQESGRRERECAVAERARALLQLLVHELGQVGELDLALPRHNVLHLAYKVLLEDAGGEHASAAGSSLRAARTRRVGGGGGPSARLAGSEGREQGAHDFGGGLHGEVARHVGVGVGGDDGVVLCDCVVKGRGEGALADLGLVGDAVKDTDGGLFRARLGQGE